MYLTKQALSFGVLHFLLRPWLPRAGHWMMVVDYGHFREDSLLVVLLRRGFYQCQTPVLARPRLQVVVAIVEDEEEK